MTKSDSDSADSPEPRAFTDPSPDPDADRHLAVLGDALQEHGVTRVVVHYEGSGDSGGVAEVEYLPEGVRLPAWVEGRLRKLAEDYCPDGYENDEGGYGSLTLYPAEGLAEREHRARDEDAEPMAVAPARLPGGLRRRLARLGVTGVSLRFDGYGDEGQVDELILEPEAVRLDAGLPDELEDFLLGQLPGGWEINEGSYGEFTVDVPSGRVTVEAYGRVECDSEPVLTRWKWRP